MQIDTMALGDFQTNCYIVRESPQTKTCTIIDPGYDAHELVEFLQREELSPQRILLTHGHADHIAGIPLLGKNFDDPPVSIGRDEAVMLRDNRLNLSVFSPEPLQLADADTLFEPGDVLEFAGSTFDVLATPGHTPGSVSFYCQAQNCLFAGDALFAGSIGRTDFPGGNHQTLLESIRQALLVLPDDTLVYPGHGPATTIGRERASNPFLLTE